MPRRASRLAVIVLLAFGIGSLAGSEPAGATGLLPALPAPVAAGTSAGNMQLSGASKWILTRWVARASGTLSALHLRIQADGSSCRQSGRTGYGLGDGGSWVVTTHPVLPDGRPDTSLTLSTVKFRPCDAAAPLADVRQGIVRLPMDIAVTRGVEYATIVRNSDPEPTRNFTSVNFLYTKTGILGANGRNERSALAPDAYYGLDPRELVGYSSDAGRTWALPGGQYGVPGGRNFLPTYIQEFADGRLTGQPYYYTAAPSTTARTMVYRGVSGPWVISSLGAFTAKAGSGTLTLTVDGKERAQVNVTGVGMLRAAITPVTVAPGQVVKVRSSGLSIQNVVADTAWGRLMGLHLTTSPWRVEGEPNFSHAAPVYALPAYNGTNALMRTDPRLHRAGRVARKHARATKHKHARRARTHGRARDTQLRAR